MKTGIVFSKTLKDARTNIIIWGGVLALMACMMMLFYPTVKTFPGLNELLDSMPPAIKALAGDVEDFTSLEGFLATKFFSMGPVFLAIFAVQFGASTVAGEERQGTLDLLMSTPISRRQVIIEKFVAFIVSLLGVLLMIFLGMVFGAFFIPDIAVPFDRVLAATLNLAPIALMFGALTFLLATTLSQRLPSSYIAVGAVVGFYVFNLLGQMAEALQPLQVINPFHYHGTRTLFDGLNVGNVLILVAVAVVMLVASALSFEQRDLAT